MASVIVAADNWNFFITQAPDFVGLDSIDQQVVVFLDGGGANVGFMRIDTWAVSA
jgi:hypothetical protein